MDEILMIFDPYDIPHSLKQATRARRTKNDMPMAYHITDHTNIAKVPLKKLLAHSDTKKELTAYLAEKLLTYSRESQKQVVVAWGSICRASHKDFSYLDSDQEEADTNTV